MGTDKTVYQDEYFLALDEKRKLVAELNAEPYIEHWRNLSLDDIEGEIWVDITLKGVEGIYRISNFERVKSLARVAERKNVGNIPIKEHIRSHGYCKSTGYRNVGLKNKSTNTEYHGSIHVLMAIYFVPNPDPLKYKQVNHLTGNKWDNRPKNLEWVTRRQDLIHKYHILNYKFPKGSREGKNSVSSRKVIQKTMDDKFIKEWESQGQISRELGYCQSDISLCCNGKNKSSHGFKWEFKDKK